MRRLPLFTAALVCSIALSMLATSAVNAATGEENSFVSKINSERSSRGLGTLRWRQDLADVARRHSQRMAQGDNLHHNPNLRNEVSGWDVIGENVGYGPSVSDLHDAFMASQSHKANILDSDYTHVGVGTLWKDGTLWVTEVFMRPSASSNTQKASSPTRRRSAPRPKKQTAPRPVQPALPPAKPITAPPPPPAASEPANDLTRMMVTNLLGGDDPAVGTIGLAESYYSVAPLDEHAAVRLSFRAFSRMAGRVSQSLLRGKQ